jgi:hypothetical protein
LHVNETTNENTGEDRNSVFRVVAEKVYRMADKHFEDLTELGIKTYQNKRQESYQRMPEKEFRSCYHNGVYTEGQIMPQTSDKTMQQSDN